MARDVELAKNDKGELDIQVKDGEFVLADDFSNKVFISLFSWERAQAGDKLDPGQSKMGWWGDAVSGEEGIPDDPIGSRLWLLARSKLSADTMMKFIDYCKEALKWVDTDPSVEKWSVNIIRSEGDPNRTDAEFLFFRAEGLVHFLASEIAAEVQNAA